MMKQTFLLMSILFLPTFSIANEGRCISDCEENYRLCVAPLVSKTMVVGSDFILKNIPRENWGIIEYKSNGQVQTGEAVLKANETTWNIATDEQVVSIKPDSQLVQASIQLKRKDFLERCTQIYKSCLKACKKEEK